MKISTLAAALLLPGLFAQAQTKQIQLGVKAGANFSLFTRSVAPFSEVKDRKYLYFKRDVRYSAMGGVTADFLLTKGFSVGAEVLYSSKGMGHYEENEYVIVQDDDGDHAARNRYTYVIDYLEVPVLLKYDFWQHSDQTSLTAYAGLAPSKVIYSKTKLRYAKSTNSDGYRVANEDGDLNDVRLYNNSVLFGVQIGDKRKRNAHVYGDVRGSYAVRPVFTRSEADNATKMWTFTLAVGIKI